MSGSDRGKSGVMHHANTGLAIEPQHLSVDGLNVLRPGELYEHKTTYQFGATPPLNQAKPFTDQ